MSDIGNLILHHKALREKRFNLPKETDRLCPGTEITGQHLEIRLLEHHINAHLRVFGNKLILHPVSLLPRIAARRKEKLNPVSD